MEEQPIQQINFAVNAYQSRSRLMSSERVLNFYSELTPSDSPFKTAVLFSTPGLKSWVSSASFNPVYGMQVMGDFLYVVIGLTLYKISKNKTIVSIGTLGTTPGQVMMTENGVQLTILTEGGASYYYNVDTNTFGQITDGDYQLANSITTIDGYTVFSKVDSGQFFISALRDTTIYSALDFATAEALSDNIVRIVTFNRQLYIFGTNSIEIWYDTGNSTFPLQRIDGALIQKGLGAKFSTAVETTGIYWLGDDGIVYRTNNYTAEKISTFAIDYQISTYSKIDDAIGLIYSQAGHEFYCLTFPTAGKTWVYDLMTQLWTERGSLNATRTQVEQWGCLYQAYFAGKNIVSGAVNGKLYELDLDTYTEDGTPIIRKAVSATQFSTYNYKEIDKLGLMMDFGVGIDGNGQGFEPKVMVRFSLDGGYNFTDAIDSKIGSIGSYLTELFFEKLGNCKSFICEVTISDPVKSSILGGFLKYKDGAF